MILTSYLSFETNMRRTLRTTVTRVSSVIVIALVTPALGAAQSTARVAADAPSTNRETHVQHDSLAVHFLRAPKAKPGTRSTAANPSKGKGGSKVNTPVDTIRVETPLPTRRAKAKQ